MLVSESMQHMARFPMQRIGCRSQKGFTLTEALIVMAVMTILLAMALPSFSDFTREQRIRAAAFDLVSDLMQARSEAIKRSSIVTLTGLGSEWAGGWTVTVDSGLHTGTAIRNRESPGNAVALTGASSLSFDRNGRLAAGGTAALAIEDRVSLSTRRCIVVDLSGLAQSRVGACP